MKEDKEFTKNKLLVSICTITYNHAPYIRDCLDGFLMQKANFDFEILIHDDASTDGTEEIIREYEAKYPDIIKPLYETENQWVKGRIGSKVFNYPRAKGKYIALCEGDDYWTDPLKLQKQVDFMEANPECSMCFHATKTEFMSQEKLSKIAEIEKLKVDKDTIISSREFIEKMYARSVGVFLKSEIANSLPTWVSKAPIGDIPLQLTCADNGSIGYIAGEPMAVYRRGIEGAWSANEKLGMATEEGEKWAINRLETWLSIFNSFNEHTAYRYDKEIKNRLHGNVYGLSSNFLDHNSRKKTLQILKKYKKDLPLMVSKNSLLFWIKFVLGSNNFEKARMFVNKLKV